MRPMPSCDPESPLRFRSLLYRYFFFDWLFVHAGTQDAYRRNAAWQHNRSQARWLPVYLRRWSAGMLLMYALGALVEHGWTGVVLCAPFYVAATACVAVIAVICAAWVGLRAGP